MTTTPHARNPLDIVATIIGRGFDSVEIIEGTEASRSGWIDLEITSNGAKVGIAQIWATTGVRDQDRRSWLAAGQPAGWATTWAAWELADMCWPNALMRELALNPRFWPNFDDPELAQMLLTDAIEAAVEASTGIPELGAEELAYQLARARRRIVSQAAHRRSTTDW